MCPHKCPHRSIKLTMHRMALPPATQVHPAMNKSARSFLPTLSQHFVAFHTLACNCRLILHTQEVAGSSPAAPTTSFGNLQRRAPLGSALCDVTRGLTLLRPEYPSGHFRAGPALCVWQPSARGPTSREHARYDIDSMLVDSVLQLPI